MSTGQDALDRWLIRLAWIGPVALIVLLRWQMSLDRWYVPLNSPDFARMSAAITEEASPWLATIQGGRGVFLVTDPDCPCTRPAIQRVRAAMDETQPSLPTTITLNIIPIDDPDALNDVAWRRVIQNIPSTPTLIVVVGNSMQYIGPAVSGSLCLGDTSVAGVLGAAEPSGGAAVNYVDKGCFCAVPRHPGPGSRVGQGPVGMQERA